MRVRLLGVCCSLAVITACAPSSSSSPGTPPPTDSSASTSGSQTETAGPSESTPQPAATTICDAAALGAVMNTTTSDDAELVQLVDVTCDGDWAVAIAVSRVTSTTTVQAVVVFQHTPDGWVQQDREGSCSSGVVPEALRAAACEAP